MDILDKLHDFNRKTSIDHEIVLRADGSGHLSRASFPFEIAIEFSSLQDLREQMYRIILNTEKS